MEGEQPKLGDLLAMVINHVLTGMILQVNTFSQVVFLIGGSTRGVVGFCLVCWWKKPLGVASCNSDHRVYYIFRKGFL